MARRPYAVVRRNVNRIIDGGGNERDVQNYLQGEGYNEQIWQAATRAYNETYKRQRQVNPVNAVIVGLTDGLSLNTTDEFAGRNAVARFQRQQEGKALGELVTGNPQRAVNRVKFAHGSSGRNTRENLRSAATNNARQAQQNLRQTYPIQYAGGAIVGGVAPFLTGAGEARAATQATKLGVRLGRNALIGGAIGAGAGAGEATEGNRVQGAITGGVLGGITGAVLPETINVAGGVGRRLSNVYGNKMTPQVVEQNAARFVIRQINPQEVQAELARLRASGLPNVTLADASASLARRTGAIARGGADNVRELAAQRGGSMVNEVPATMAQAARRLSPRKGTVEQNTQRINNSRRRVQNRLISPIAGQRVPLNEAQINILGSNLMRRSANDTINIMNLNRSMFGSNNPLDEQVIENVVYNKPMPKEFNALNVGHSNNLPIDLSIGGADDLRQSMQDAATEAYNANGKARLARALTMAKNDFINPFREAVPAYDNALNIGNMMHSEVDAMGRGSEILNNKIPNADLRDSVNQFTPRELRGFRLGAAQNMASQFPDTRINEPLITSLAGRSQIQDRVSAVFGQDAQQSIENTAQAAMRRLNSGRAINPNIGSQTAERNLETQLMQGEWIPRSIPDASARLLGEFAKKLGGLTQEERYAIVDLVTNPNAVADVEQLLRIQELANQRQVPLPPILENAIRGLLVGVPAQTSGRSMGN